MLKIILGKEILYKGPLLLLTFQFRFSMSFLSHAYQFCCSLWCNCVLIYGAKMSEVAIIVVTSFHPPATASKESILHKEIKALNLDDKLYNT